MPIGFESRKPVDTGAFLAGMRRLTGAVTLVTTTHRDVRHGLTATAVCSLTADPPSLLACVNIGASAHDPMESARVFAVNVLADDQADLARLFANTAVSSQRFQSGLWSIGVTGAPLLDGALVSFDCEVEQRIPKGTHSIFIGSVKDVRLGAGKRALVYHDGVFGTISGVDGA